MKFFIIAAAITSLLPTVFGLTINTPSSVVQCQPALLTWLDGTPPYYLSIIPGGQTTAAALKSFNSTSATSLTWTVDIAAGTGITLQLRDSTGTIAYSDIITIQSSSNSSCVSTSTVASGSNGATTATAPSTASTRPATTGTSTGNPGTSTHGSTTSTSAPSSSASSRPNSAARGVVASYGLAGIACFLGIVAAM